MHPKKSSICHEILSLVWGFRPFPCGLPLQNGCGMARFRERRHTTCLVPKSFSREIQTCLEAEIESKGREQSCILEFLRSFATVPASRGQLSRPSPLLFSPRSLKYQIPMAPRVHRIKPGRSTSKQKGFSSGFPAYQSDAYRG